MLDFAASLVPSWLNFSSAWLFAIAGFAAAVYGLFPLAPYRRLAKLAGLVGLGYAAYLAGYAGAQASCEAAELQQRVDALESQNKGLRQRIETAEAARRADAARAASDFTADKANQENIDATPHNDRACLDRDAAARIRGVQ